MKLKHLFISFLLVPLAASCSPLYHIISSGEPSPSSDPISSGSGGLTFKKAPIYKDVRDEEKKVTSAVNMGELTYCVSEVYGDNRAFVSLNSFLGVSEISGPYEVTFASGALTYSFSDNSASFSINENGDVSIIDLSLLGPTGRMEMLDLGGIDKEGFHAHMTVASYKKSGAVTYSLKDHSLPFYLYENDVYLLTSVISVFFLYGRLTNLAYNGKDFYYVNSVSSLQNDGTGGSLFSEQYYGTSPMHSETTKSEAVAKLDADAFIFALDVVYGFKYKEEFKDGYGAYLKNNYPSVYGDLYSTDASKVLEAYDHIVTCIMGDGHSSISYSYPSGIGSFYNEGKHSFDKNAHPDSERVNALFAVSDRLTKQRNEALGISGDLGAHYLDISGDTAVIRFDEFKSARLSASQSESVYEENVAKDNFSLFHVAYKKIAEAGTVKNVIIDVSLNGGGNVYALIETLGFILENPVVKVFDHASKVGIEASYRIDCNANGVYEENESPASLYTHYVLTSGFSFSCGNSFPAHAQFGGIKTIGQRSGGGSCCVLPFVTSDGYAFDISSAFEMGMSQESDPSVDSGLTPDIEIAEESFYDIAKLKEAISA